MKHFTINNVVHAILSSDEVAEIISEKYGVPVYDVNPFGPCELTIRLDNIKMDGDK